MLQGRLVNATQEELEDLLEEAESGIENIFWDDYDRDLDWTPARGIYNLYRSDMYHRLKADVEAEMERRQQK